jgi:bifunctional DNA-binding transcriptional regulator/antitoxin component of YhaV-PrlF toxin-antitoxin module
MVRTLITSKGQTTVPIEFRREWGGSEIYWERCEDGSVRVRPVPDVLSLFGAAKSALPKAADEKAAARALMGQGDRDPAA